MAAASVDTIADITICTINYLYRNTIMTKEMEEKSSFCVVWQRGRHWAPSAYTLSSVLLSGKQENDLMDTPPFDATLGVGGGGFVCEALAPQTSHSNFCQVSGKNK